MDDEGDYFDPDRLEDLPIVTPGVTVLIQLRDPSVGTIQPDGTTLWELQRCEPMKMVIQDRETCIHMDEICPECIDSWQMDWLINLPETPFDLGFKEA